MEINGGVPAVLGTPPFAFSHEEGLCRYLKIYPRRYSLT